MKVRTLEDGTLVLDERLTLLRWGAVTGAVTLVAVFTQTAIVRGPLTSRDILGAATGLIALMTLAACVTDRSFRFDRASGRMRWEIRRLFGAHSGDVPFSDVFRVTLHTSVAVDTQSRRVNYQPFLSTGAGELPLSSFHRLDPGACEALTRAISDTIGRPLDAPRAATVEELVATDRVIEAVTKVRRERGLDLAGARAVVDAIRLARRAAGRTAA